MIPTFYFFIGFLIYTGFCIVTFNIYSKVEDEMKRRTGLIIIYFYYSILVAYVINFVDVNGTVFEKTVQTITYVVAQGFFLWFNYKNQVLKEDTKYI